MSFTKIEKEIDNHIYKIEVVSDEDTGMSVLTELTTKSVIRLQNSGDGGVQMFMGFQYNGGPRHIESWT